MQNPDVIALAMRIDGAQRICNECKQRVLNGDSLQEELQLDRMGDAKGLFQAILMPSIKAIVQQDLNIQNPSESDLQHIKKMLQVFEFLLSVPESERTNLQRLLSYIEEDSAELEDYKALLEDVKDQCPISFRFINPWVSAESGAKNDQKFVETLVSSIHFLLSFKVPS
jgi:hypothetical protein